ncbi:MAG TPA: hypothetical protein DCM40_17875, partial [Maribacter sp.]|nr:hypothetical protein [Maribacter sp.]
VHGAYYDSAFSLESFVSKQATEVINSLNIGGNFSGLYYADIDPVYNFLSTAYEEALQSSDISHTRIPNLYEELRKLKDTGGDGANVFGEYLEGIL